MKMTALDKVANVLLVIGGLNWGLVGFFKYNLIDEIFGVESGVSRVIYALVGLAALWVVWSMVVMMSSAPKPAADSKATMM